MVIGDIWIWDEIEIVIKPYSYPHNYGSYGSSLFSLISMWQLISIQQNTAVTGPKTAAKIVF